MCGSIKYENTGAKIGNLVVGKKMDKILVRMLDGSVRYAQWLGFSRTETSQSSDAIPVQILAKSYTERGVDFFIPEGQAINAIMTVRSSFPEGIGVFIKTRPATAQELKRCPHDRHPVISSII